MPYNQIDSVILEKTAKAPLRRSRHSDLLRTYRPERWQRKMLSILKARAKQKGWEFNLTIEDMILPEVCPVLGIELRQNSGQPSPNSPSIDRFDSRRGYVKGNVRIISHRANVLKSDATIAEMEAVLAYMRGRPQGRVYSQTAAALSWRRHAAKQTLEWHERRRAKNRKQPVVERPH
jgi:hypothetical protein